MTVQLDEGDLVWVAAVVSSLDAEVVLHDCDVAALARVVARSESAAEPYEAAASLLSGIAAERPFARDNGAVAWLAAAQLLRLNGLTLRVNEIEARALVGRAAAGDVDDTTLAKLLATTGTAWRCPTCQRVVFREHAPGRWYGSDACELVALCARQHHAHDRWGRPRPAPPADPTLDWRELAASPPGTWWLPVVWSGADVPTCVVLAPDPSILLRVEGGDGCYAAYAIAGVEASQLVGSTTSLLDRATKLGTIGVDTVRFDSPRRGAIDAASLRSVDLVGAREGTIA